MKKTVNVQNNQMNGCQHVQLGGERLPACAARWYGFL